MSYKYYIADVFTKQIFNGAQVAVFPNAEGLSDDSMAKIARELNLTETVFLIRQSSLESTWKMRVFSPYAEIDYTGHPIVAAAYVLASCEESVLDKKNTAITFQQNIGSALVFVSNNSGKPGSILYTRQVSPVVDYYAPTDGELAKFLSIEESQIDNKKYCTRLVSCGFPYLIVPVFYYETVREARFNFAAWSQSSAPQTSAQEILLVSPRTPNQDSDFAIRLLGPNIGLHEDPPVGSTMASFAAYLCSFAHVKKGTHIYSVERGDEKVRRSVINLEMDNKGEDTLTIRVGGEAVIVAEGMMHIPD